MLPNNSLSHTFKSAITVNRTLKQQNKTLHQQLSEQSKHLHNITAILSTFDNNLQTRIYPIIIGNASTRMSVLTLGTLPHKENLNLIKKHCIFPLNFVAKRKYKQHANCKRKSVDEKVFYMCKVEKCPFIECVCGKIYKYGEFEIFMEDTKCSEICSMEDFFGLTYVNVVKMVENMGDTSVYEGYVRLCDRQKKD